MKDYQFVLVCFLCGGPHMSVNCQVGNPFVDSSAKQGCQDYQFASVCFLCGGSHMSVDC